MPWGMSSSTTARSSVICVAHQQSVQFRRGLNTVLFITYLHDACGTHYSSWSPGRARGSP